MNSPDESNIQMNPKDDSGQTSSKFIEAIDTGIVSQRELSKELGFKEALSIGLGGMQQFFLSLSVVFWDYLLLIPT
ncbi:MAG: hypothetical protein ACTSQK_09915 [Candidatus Heimdallarchaeota archaeon]